MTVGQIIIVDGKADTGSTRPKILVDIIRTEIKILEPLSASSPLPPPVNFFEEETPLPDDAHVTDVNYKSTQPKPSTPQQKNVPAPVTPSPQTKRTVPPPARQVAEKPAPTYTAKPVVEETWDATDVPPPPDNFPEDWDMQWQPSFEDASIAARSEPKVEI